jgi:hypothetical protein
MLGNVYFSHCVALYLMLYGFLFVGVDMPDEQILNGNQPEMDDFVASENQDEEVVAMVEEFPSGI